MRVIYFDGLCGLCDRFVRYIVPRDRSGRYHFAPLQGTTAQARLSSMLDPRTSQTVILEEEGRFRVRSDAALAILAGLGGWWRAITLLRIVPRPLRDAGYDWVARNRHRWFSRLTECRVPAPDERGRFLA